MLPGKSTATKPYSWYLSLQIGREDLIGLESETRESLECLRLLYMPFTGGGKKPVRKLVKTPYFIVDSTAANTIHELVDSCVSVQRKNVMLIINPKSGKGDAEALIEKECMPILEAVNACVDSFTTQSPQHAMTIVRDADLSKYHTILSAGGDGTFHEILQGILRRDDWKTCVESLNLMQVPCGSGNALAASSGIWDVSTAAYTAIKGRESKIDVTSIIQPSTNTIMYSFLSITYGLVANLDIGTEHLRWMGGQRFVWGAIREILSQRVYSCNVMYVEDTASQESRMSSSSTSGHVPLQFLGPLLSENGMCATSNSEENIIDGSWKQISGDFQLFSMSNLPWLDMNFNLHPHARMAGGSYNFIYCLGKQGIIRSMKLMTESEAGNHMHLVEEKQIKAFRIEPIAEDTWLVVDGEAIERATIYGEIHPELIRILLPN